MLDLQLYLCYYLQSVHTLFAKKKHGSLHTVDTRRHPLRPSVFMTAPPHGGTVGISIDDRFSESHYFPHTNENSASQGRFSRFGEVAPPPRQVMPVCRSFFDKTSTAPSVLATLGHLPHTGAAKSLHTLSRHLFIKATAFPHVTSSLPTHESSGDITPVTSSLPPLGGSGTKCR